MSEREHMAGPGAAEEVDEAARTVPVERLEEWLITVGGEDDTLDGGLRRTIVPSRREPARAGQALALLEELAASGAPKVRQMQTLGRGGMGVIRLAEQVALGREVAVKSLREDKKSRDATLELLREAWITGRLEHPNVAPVYDLGLDADGTPLIVLKRIEGVTWAELVHDAAAVAERFGATDLLAWNLGILMQVLNAVRFAHSRGIIHRDLKPANVMIGEFGEVYLLDWGIAVSLRYDPHGRLPLAAEANEMAGTPGYMAPEMLGGAPEQLSERTDVYLCGAILYEIITGTPPHGGTTAQEVIDSVRESAPALPRTCPPELARIFRRATDPDPNGRFESAEQLRLALQGFLQHRGSAQLAERAELRLEDMLSVLRTPSPDASYRQRLYDLYGACRFGFRESLSAWPRNARAEDGLCRAAEAMVEYELGQGNAPAAASLLDEIPEPPAALRRRIAGALAAEEQRKVRIAELERLGRDFDMRVGQRTRVFVAFLIGIGVMVIPIVAIVFDAEAAFATYGRLATWSAGFLGFTLAIALWARESLMASAINRRLLASLVCMLVAQKLMLLGMWMMEMPPVEAALMHMFLWSFTLGMLAMTVDVRLLPSAVAFMGSFLFAVHAPDLRFYGMAASTALLTVNITIVWRPSPDATARARGNDGDGADEPAGR